jgi:hypothetical protein
LPKLGVSRNFGQPVKDIQITVENSELSQENLKPLASKLFEGAASLDHCSLPNNFSKLK